MNVRLVDGGFCGRFEMNLGTVQPGGEAQPHWHGTEHQVMYVLEGECEVTLGDDHPVTCGPGTVVRIPPKLRHRVVATGDTPMRAIVLYSPPLGPGTRSRSGRPEPRRGDPPRGPADTDSNLFPDRHRARHPRRHRRGSERERRPNRTAGKE